MTSPRRNSPRPRVGCPSNQLSVIIPQHGPLREFMGERLDMKVAVDDRGRLTIVMFKSELGNVGSEKPIENGRGSFIERQYTKSTHILEGEELLKTKGSFGKTDFDIGSIESDQFTLLFPDKLRPAIRQKRSSSLPSGTPQAPADPVDELRRCLRFINGMIAQDLRLTPSIDGRQIKLVRRSEEEVIG